MRFVPCQNQNSYDITYKKFIQKDFKIMDKIALKWFKSIKNQFIVTNKRYYSQLQTKETATFIVPGYANLCPGFIENNKNVAESLINSMTVHNDFITESEENSILEEIEPYMKRLRYEFDHWDNAIHGYRETERLQWNAANTEILNRVRSIAFSSGVAQLKYVHILDLDKKGYIKPHIDAVRFCGDTIAGLSLLTDSVMRLVHDKHKELFMDVLLKRRSLYIMKGSARFEYTHEILSNEKSVFKGKEIVKDRRISVICRNEPGKNV